MDSIQKKIIKFSKGQFLSEEDMIASESPLEIRIRQKGNEGLMQKKLAVTMRTAGNDLELTKGFLFTEGIIQDKNDIINIEKITDEILEVELSHLVNFDLSKIDRNFFVSSSCGVCGKASKENIETESPFLPWAAKLKVSATLITNIGNNLKEGQTLFQSTGGVHGVALVDAEGNFQLSREDVGRHNAMDKVIGAALESMAFPLNDYIVLVSGRASFELVQKAGMAGIGIFCAVGAPSSLAIELAEAQGMTLIGFLKEEGFNIYAGVERITE